MINVANIKIKLLTEGYDSSKELKFLSAFSSFMIEQGFNLKKTDMQPVENKNGVVISISEFKYEF
jgi:hypothetical protein